MKNTVTISFTGDMMCEREMAALTGNQFDGIFPHIKDAMKGSDYVVGNLETPVAGEELRFTFERYAFNTSENYLVSLKKAGFDLLSLANNHVMDRGEEGLLKTLENCRKYGFDVTGTNAAEDASRVIVREIGGIKVAFIAYTYGTNAFAHRRFLEHEWMVNLFQPEETKDGSIHLLESAEDIAAKVEELYRKPNPVYDAVVKPYLERLEEDIKRAKEEADYVIVLAHVGGQRNGEPDAYSRFIMEKLREFGADLIIGNHPHVIQPSEKKDSVFTAYCLGNLIFTYHPEDPADVDIRYSVILHLKLEKTEKGISEHISFEVFALNEVSGVACPENAFALWKETGDETVRKTALSLANVFAGGLARYEDIAEEYDLY